MNRKGHIKIEMNRVLEDVRSHVTNEFKQNLSVLYFERDRLSTALFSGEKKRACCYDVFAWSAESSKLQFPLVSLFTHRFRPDVVKKPKRMLMF